MSKRIAFAPLAAAIGLGFSLLAGSLVTQIGRAHV